MFEDLIRDWDGEAIAIHYHAPSGTWMLVAIHSTRLGPAGGGTRMKVYPTPADGLRDAMRLSEAMTRKLAIAGAPSGGGKAVLAVPAIPQGEARRELLLAYGELIASLRGSFRTAPDVNTDDRDMDVLLGDVKTENGLVEIRAQLLDVGRLEPTDPRLAGYAGARDPERWPRPGEELVLHVTGVTSVNTATTPSVRALALEPWKFEGQNVTLIGQFRGRNLFGDLPAGLP